MTERGGSTLKQEHLSNLLKRVASKDKSAFRELYDLTSSRLMTLLVKQMGNEQEAADALQLSYLALWKRAHRYNSDKGKALTWMIVVARNTAIDILRRRRFNLVPDDCCQEMEDGGPALIDLALRRNSRSVLTQHLETLPDKQREALHLYYFEDLTFDEVALRMNASPNTARSWGRRGLIALRHRLQGQSLNDFL